jgi:hypothetical protein
VVYGYNPSYSRGRDQEDRDSKLIRAKTSQDSISKKKKKKNHRKRAGGVAQGVVPEFKPQYCKKKKKEREPMCKAPST